MSPSHNQVKCGSAQVVRIMYRDYDATDSESDSSSDEGTKPVGKTIMKTVVISKPRSTSMESDDKRQQQQQKKYRGVRKRLSGRWCAEIRDKTAKKRLWLGTFDTPEEAAAAYNGARRRIRGTDFTVEDNNR